MKQNLASRILHRLGWKILMNVQLPDQCVVCIAPHTSNWDFIYGILFKYATSLKANFFMKKEWFRFPLGGIMRSLGGIPVNRDKKQSMTDAIAEQFKHYPVLHIGITPEGTRSYNPDWKKGFYYIAQKANVPIVLAQIDYKRKEIGLGKIFQPTGDVDTDMTTIKKYYSNIGAKFPEKFACE